MAALHGPAKLLSLPLPSEKWCHRGGLTEDVGDLGSFCEFGCERLGYGIQPVLIVTIPEDRISKTGFKRMSWYPAQFSVNLGGIDCVAAIVAKPVFNVRNIAFVHTQLGENELGNLHVRSLVVPTDVINLPLPAAMENKIDRPAMIFHLQPISYIQSITIYRYRLLVEQVRDE